jgi:hypothetical protein
VEFSALKAPKNAFAFSSLFLCTHSLIAVNLDEEMVVTFCGIFKQNLPKFAQFSHNLLVVSPMQL